MPHRSPPPEIPTPRSVWRRIWDFVEEPKSVTLVQALAVYLVNHRPPERAMRDDIAARYKERQDHAA